VFELIETIKGALSWINPRLLKPHPLNPWLYETREDRDFLKSVGRFSVLETLVVNRASVILSGHRRWKAAKDVRRRVGEKC